jgi:hypothetical protein
MRISPEISLSASALRRGALALALLFGAAQFAGSVPARAGLWADGGSSEDRDYGADHSEVYQVQRGDKMCRSREACGGVAAIPMNRPGWFYQPRGFYVLDPPAAAPAHLPPRHHRKY